MGVGKTLKVPRKINPYSLGINSLYCTKCGRENPENSVFCQYCGGELEMRENYFHISHSLKKKLKKIFLYDLLFFLTLFAIFSNLTLGVYFLNLRSLTSTANFVDLWGIIKDGLRALVIIFTFQGLTIFVVIQKSSIYLLESNAKKALLVSGFLGTVFSLLLRFYY
jgi:hypothetical protein